ncbi:substrate-binding domain-containing protein [Desulfotomaculum nigrificans]|uniref:substrate-binding domain-containing protein n=1 Tax=Desulfotomaculum nigrificans TaxID=1565 RepID=UPI003D0804BC
MNVSAAMSLKDALEEIGHSYEKKSKQDVIINFGASGVLRQQIEQGAQVDLFISVDPQDMEILQKTFD